MVTMGCLKLTYQPTIQVLRTYDLTPSREAKSVQSWLSVDPLQFEYPHYTPYQYAGNKPISYIDLDGLEEAKKDPTPVHKPDALYVAPRPSKPAEPIDPSVLETPKGAVSFTITYEYKFDIPNNPFSRISISITGSKVSDYKFDPKGQPGYTINIKVPTLPSGSSRVVNYNNYTYKGLNLFGLYNQENWNSPDPTLAQVFFKGLTGGFYIGLASSLPMSKIKSIPKTNITSDAAKTVTNPVPKRLARVIPANISGKTLGAPDAVDVFVTAADDISGLNASQIAKRLTIPNSSFGFKVIEFNTPRFGLSSPINRTNLGFVGFGRTAGGAREFALPNQLIPKGSIFNIVH